MAVLPSSFLSSPAATPLRQKVDLSARYRRHFLIKISSLRKDGYDSDGKLIDENMIVLRKRIHEMEMTERKWEAAEKWLEWEKEYYANGYSSDVCEAVGLLQSKLMNTRPSLALGMVALIALSVPTAFGVVMAHLVEVAKWVCSGGILHIG